MALRGAELLIYPTAIGWFDGDDEDEKARQLEAWVAVQRGHAVANSLPVIAVNRVGFESAALSEVSPDEILSGEMKFCQQATVEQPVIKFSAPRIRAVRVKF